ncbi:MAG: nitroreductase family protein [Planctomycetota bacterium]|jgi:iodotyrosine deiodinase|nr:nitroreductase family protein [Phycisphaerales bacterium]MEC8064627.1 nitroreductase family protein [Planctomycetota bacterium]RZO53465.1 MAG: nitroreductase family protein [Phycisphaeraceae bacterium]MDP7401463.1 nitroreductase family protein [Phycisphaerales bacterium]MEC8093208.1 nitroreductase family protein [Planctomycetota bacterium]|tara:strand:- start:87 stop:740 length:654 start_codon:yes stop_codon:yes gene_type:complete
MFTQRPHQILRPQEPVAVADAFFEKMNARRSVRQFSDEPVPEALIRSLIATAGTAPSGANKQPWRFAAVQDPALKSEIRCAAEAEEQAFYSGRASEDWLRDLAPIGTNDQKPFLEEAPWLIVVLKRMRDDRDERLSDKVYYVNESVGIATGLLLAAAQHAGLATLTHTPSPMGFLANCLGASEHERPFVLIPIGWPHPNAMVPDQERKPLDDILTIH